MATENDVKKKHGFATAMRWILGIATGGLSELFVNKDALEMSEEVLEDSGSSLLSGFGRIGENLINKYGESGLTERDIAMNDMALSNMQAQADIDRQLRRAEYIDKVDAANAAGINPIFAVSGGVNSPAVSAPSTPAAGNNGDFGSLVNVLGSLMLAFTGSEKNRAEVGLIKAQERNTEADTGKKEAETGKILSETQFINLQKSWYPDLSDATIRDINQRISTGVSEVSLNEATTARTWVETSLSEIEKEWLPKLRETEVQLNSDRSEEAKANAAAAFARSVVDDLEAKYMRDNNSHMGNSEFITIAEWLLSRFGTSSRGVTNSVLDVLQDRFNSRRGRGGPISPEPVPSESGAGGR